MADVVGSDIPEGKEVKWYAGGTATVLQGIGPTVPAITSAERGSVFAMVNGLEVEVTETGDEIDGVAATIDAPGAGEEWVIKYIDMGDGLFQVGASTGVKCGSSAGSRKAAIDGQSNKLVSVGAIENTAEISNFQYNREFLAACMGTLNEGATKWSNAFAGMHKVNLVGKRYVDGIVVQKWFIVGATPNAVDSDFPTEDWYKDSMKFDVDWWGECDVEAEAPGV